MQPLKLQKSPFMFIQLLDYAGQQKDYVLGLVDENWVKEALTNFVSKERERERNFLGKQNKFLNFGFRQKVILKFLYESRKIKSFPAHRK